MIWRDWIALALLAACSAPAVPADLARAEAHEHAGEDALALQAYEAAVHSCKTPVACGRAHHGRAELLDRMGRREEAVRAYEAFAERVPEAPVEDRAKAMYRAGTIRLELGDDEGGYRLLWRTITAFPDAGVTDHAAKLIVLDGRRRAPRQLFEELGKLANRIPETEIADNLWYAMAELAADELEDPATAIGLYDHVIETYPDGPLLDDALWHGARLARASGDPKGAVRRYRALLARREIAWINGSYLSEWMDDSQLALGTVLRDDLGDFRAALQAFVELPELYPDSILHDDAMYERAVTHARIGDRDSACRALATLASRWPESKYLLERGPALRDELECSIVAPP